MTTDRELAWPKEETKKLINVWSEEGLQAKLGGSKFNSGRKIAQMFRSTVMVLQIVTTVFSSAEKVKTAPPLVLQKRA
ncbi:UNVERIFIED_CONTAM: hypothetical protein FKN15_029244 [Acipenser sinensis]